MGSALSASRLQMMFPAEEQHSELRAPVADVVVGDDAVAEQAQRAREAVSEDRGADVAHVHRLGHIRRAEINHRRFSAKRISQKTNVPRARRLRAFARARKASAGNSEARAGNFHFVAKSETSSLASTSVASWRGFSFPRLGERHERVALVIAEFRVGTRTDQNGEERRHPARRRGRRLAVSVQFVCEETRREFNHG